MKKIMIVNTSYDQFDGFDLPTGLWLSELVHFYDVFQNNPNYQLDIYNINGGETPIDPVSMNKVTLDRLTKKYYEDETFMRKLHDSPSIDEVDVTQYDVIYFTGGHGVMYDFRGHDTIARAVNDIYDRGGLVSSVCHGASALLEIKRPNDHFLIEGQKLTGFSNREESIARRKKQVPYQLETALKEKGALYQKSIIPLKSFVVEEEQLITGQNPASARDVGEAIKLRLDVK
ncbi:type 1 glutamine amidotransferase domain-containing protein [Staphylococcus pseudintermedius]|uniref:type 1 glutamine amidotransferase domain-containing protein n=1 Tax=Staphylococcus pseudintermedius TaxID=283734 RepID=UPI001D4111D1|nr:type 1 glutamine amidotransferase domain-containing protein [Staphylococcus pseudintermedius]EKF6269904.1 type 1 glutamine amidotransferase domain-containing protein [Staphylococcus pseudintermedius]MCE5481423.1 type 1 glutamine amidotransferase domain-containing protein [Staphylococcus pseudintermedius]MCE5729582.1 type 1 glutamine amidotransferase domain-containing protein [Staphylococcus pseudintermedius]HBJ9560311.1 type 1 glutamine amidotransferase domain-containing protein [Staphylococ